MFLTFCERNPDYCKLNGDDHQSDFASATMTRVEQDEVFTTLYQEGTSLKNLHHMAQLFLSDRFQMYDYGPVLNKLVYSSNDERPPEIDLSSIRVPLVIIGAESDEFCPPG